MIRTRVCGLLGIEYPIALGGLGGGHTRPEMVAAVSEAGGFGAQGCHQLTPAQIHDAAVAIRSLTSKPFAFNFLMFLFDEDCFAAALCEKPAAIASEFFGVTFPGKKAARRRKEFIAALEPLQETVGDLNDISVHEGLTERLVDAQENGDKPKRGAAKEAFAAGRLSGREEARFNSVLKDAERAYARFAKARPFWR